MATPEETTSSDSNSQRPSMSMKMVIYGIKKSFPQVANINCNDLQQMREKNDEKIIYLDTRDPQEHAVSHIPGSIQLDYKSEDPWNGLDLSNAKQVVCYCSVGYRSSIVADKLRQHFQTQGNNVTVYNLEGGLFQWAIEGRELEGKKKSCVHPYNNFWGKLLPAHLRYSTESNL